MSTIALIVAGGNSQRFGGELPKQFCSLAGRPLLSWTIQRFEEANSIDQIYLVIPDEFQSLTQEKVIAPFKFSKVSKTVIGGASRVESVERGLESLPDETTLVAIHDGARPLVGPSDIDRVVAMARSDHAALLVQPVTDTLKHVTGGVVECTVDRSEIYQAQTPQVFEVELIRAALRTASNTTSVTDDASLLELNGVKVSICQSQHLNFKITTSEDLALAEALILRRE